MTKAKPTTATEASELLTDLEPRRLTLEATIKSAGLRRAGAATAAEFGDDAAKATLQQIAAEEAQAQDALRNLDSVIAEVRLLRDKLRAVETTARESAAAAALDAAVDELLALDDELDAALDHARDLAEKRRELARSPILRNAKTKFAGALVVREREVGMSILSYFDRELFFVDRHGASYASIVRAADWDARHFGRPSPAQIERGPRELTASEKAILRSASNPAPFAGGSGFDSQVENDKFHAAGGRKPIRDVSSGWPADA
jgi:adenosyl cobinamide kinase/adenosyl cobinamide phosphate guanylyltransferase